MLYIIFAIVVRNRKHFTRKEFFVIILYEILPLPAVLIEIFTDLYALTPVAITFSVLLIYVLIQAVTIEKGKARENDLEEITNKDLLTGLNNRRAYYNRVSEINSDSSLGVVFCDINGLKYTNDHYGHKSGDDLIVRFGGILTDCFGSENVFRISGDEFVVLLTDIEKKALDEKTEELKKNIGSNSNIGAIGCAYGSGSCFELLVSEAESKMYNDKKELYDTGAVSGQLRTRR